MNTVFPPNSVKLIPFNLKKETSKIAEEEAYKIAEEEMKSYFGALASDSHVSCEIELFVEFNSSFTRLF